jgi:hypothetical protein
MIPIFRSSEIGQDAEPNLAVNPAHPMQIVATAFTRDTATYYSPLYVSSDGGNTWDYRYVIPSHILYTGTADITARFAGTSNKLYVGMLTRASSLVTLNVLSIDDYNSTTPAVFRYWRDNADQPYVQATSAIGGGHPSSDRIYVGDNDKFKNATVDFSIDAYATTPRSEPIDPPIEQTDEAGVRTAIHASGVIYAVYYNVTGAHSTSGVDVANVMVVRDDHWGADHFHDLKQPVARSVSVPWTGNLGSNRLTGSHLSIAVDPNDATKVYVAWADNFTASGGVAPIYTLHVKKSTNSGQTWDPELLAIPNAVNPALAVNTNGTVAFVYQKMTVTSGETGWETHLQRSPNGDTHWSDDILSSFIESHVHGQLHNLVYLGDYLHVMAVGKDFYGVFSSSNDPSATFPNQVTYQRNRNSSGALEDGHGNPVDPSIDPFFFHVTELGPSEDFYVRDFTESSANYDEGLEPSISPRFCITSDVWNRTSNIAGSYNSNGPASITPQVGPNNFIFSRVRRKSPGAAGSADKTVSLNYYYAVFGTGNNFMPITPTSSSSLVFGAGETDKTTDGLRWTLPAGSGRHVCFAVEISTDKDPYIGTSLNHHAPGWSTGTDLLVINDNNRAQRNQFLNIVPDPPVTSRNQAAHLATTPRTTVYAVVHNPSLENMDMELNPVIHASASVKPIVTVPGTKDKFAVINNDKPIILHNMKPGESRFLQISYTVPPDKAGKTFSITFDQVKNGAVVNSFTILNQYAEVPASINENLAYEAEVFSRVNSLYRNINLPQEAKIIKENNSQTGAASREYQSYLLMDMSQLKSITSELVCMNEDDPFNLTGAVKMLEQQMKSKSTIRTANAHLALLHTIDACLTSLQLEKGNAADILQTMYLQIEILQRINSGKGDSLVLHLTTLSNEFIKQYEQRKISDDTYGLFVKNMLPELKTLVAMIASNNKSGDQLMDCL